ncbi:MAG TPA: elongation factor G, partial [Dehalococcoidales bacterium]|nr:elongation factor G [Dehalococcoidales bacterium]
RTIDMIEKRLHAKALPIQMPIGAEVDFKGAIDLIQRKAYTGDGDRDKPLVEVPIPEDMTAKVEELRHQLVERITELDDDLLNAFMEGKTISTEELMAGLRRITIANKAVPVLCGSALSNRNVRLLLDAVVDYLPSPADIPPLHTNDVKDNSAVIRAPKDEEPFTALAFKVVTDPFVGRLVYFRVYAGTVKAGDTVINSTRGKQERIGRLFLMHANRRDDIDMADTGAIVSTIGLKNTFTGDTLCSTEKPVLLEAIRFPEPVIAIAIEPKTRADQDKMGDTLRKLTEEDPTFKVNYNEETGQTVIGGMGELHLEIIVHRLLSEFGVNAVVGQPRVAYKETITESVRAEGRFIKQSGGRGQYGHVWIEMEPNTPGAGFEFVNAIKGGAIPRQFINPIEAGIKEALEGGVLAGFPLVDIKVTAVDGSYHEVDSSEMAYKMAGSIAAKSAANKAKPVLLEPIMKMEIVTPKEFMGDIIGDVTSRRGHISSIDTQEVICIIQARIPLAETFGYATTLRSMTQGRAGHSLEFDGYQQVPVSLTKDIIEKAGTKNYA